MTTPDGLPFVSCLCPTYGRPRLLENAVACFLSQTYPADRRELLILDDGGQFPFAGDLVSGPTEIVPGVRLASTGERFATLPGKYNWMANRAQGAILAVWEDDDIYLPRHLENHAAALRGGEYSKPHKIFSEVRKKIVPSTNTGGRFHASVAFTRSAWQSVGGWPEIAESGFDTRFLGNLKREFGIVDPTADRYPTYCFRWGSTGFKHGQTFARFHGDPEWWGRAKRDDIRPVDHLTPCLDDFTRQVFEEFSGNWPTCSN